MEQNRLSLGALLLTSFQKRHLKNTYLSPATMKRAHSASHLYISTADLYICQMNLILVTYMTCWLIVGMLYVSLMTSQCRQKQCEKVTVHPQYYYVEYFTDIEHFLLLCKWNAWMSTYLLDIFYFGRGPEFLSILCKNKRVVELCKPEWNSGFRTVEEKRQGKRKCKIESKQIRLDK